MVKLGLSDRNILNGAQYGFSISENPFSDLAHDVGLKEEELLKRLAYYRSLGLIKRIGFFVNYRSLGMSSALVGVRARGRGLGLLTKRLANDPTVNHNYLREHEKFNMWFTIRGVSDEDLLGRIHELMQEFTIEDYIVLKSLKTYKIAVKYELLRGVSWSSPDVLPYTVSKVDELGINRQVLALIRDIPLEKRPFRKISRKAGLDEASLVSLTRELVKKGVLLDVGATLDGEKVGFHYNAMVMIKGDEDMCMRIAREIPEASHVVYREVTYGEWPYRLYFMIHGAHKAVVDAYIHHIIRMIKAEKYEAVYSLKNLKPGVVR